MTLCKKFFVLLSLIILAVPSYAGNYSDGDVIVVLKPSGAEISSSSFTASGAETLRASEFAQASGASVKEIYPALSEAGSSIFMVIHSDSQDAEELSAMLLENPEVLAASPNYTVNAAIVPNDTSYSSCWGMEDIKAPEAWDISTGSNDVYVAIIDSGIDDTNPDLTENVALEYGRNTLNSGASARDDYGHGSHVAGIIGAKGNNGKGIAGINWNVRLISVKALNSSGAGSFESVISAVNYVVGLINQGVNIRAVNLSLETYMRLKPEHYNMVRLPLWRAFKALDNTNKAVIVVAAGNHGQTVGQPSTGYHDSIVNSSGLYVYPASFLGLYNMISVSALNRLGMTATYSNTGADISAPGGELTTLLSSAGILSTWLQSSTANITSDGVSLRAAQGTSMAAPHITGTAALLASIAPSMTAYQMRQAILRTKDTASSSSVNASETTSLNIKAALDFQSANSRDIPASGDKWVSYDNYVSYTPVETLGQEDNESNGGSGGGGGCEGIAASLVVVLGVFMLARKRMS